MTNPENEILPMNNAFLYVDSHGLPLASVMAESHKLGYAVNLDQFMLDAKAGGWTKEKAMATLEEALLMLRGEHCNFYYQKDL